MTILFDGLVIMSIIRISKKFSSILSSRQRSKIMGLILLMIVGGMLETFSVAMVLPFMDMVVNPETTMEKSYVKVICNILSIQDSRTFLLINAVTLALIYVLKNIYLILEYNIQYRFVYGNMFLVQRKLLSNFIHRPYKFFLSVNSGELLRVMNNDTPQSFALLQTLLSLFAELFVSGMLIITIFAISPVTTISIAFVLMLLLFVMNFFLKPILQRVGKENQNAAAGMNKWLLQSIQGIKELKVMSREDFFEEQFNKYGQKHVHTIRRYQMFGMFPRYFIEAISMATMFVVFAVMICVGTDLNRLLPLISAIAMAAIRLLPSINRISGALNSVAYYEPMLNKLMENIKEIESTDTEKNDENGSCHCSGNEEETPQFSDKIIMSHISFHYPGSEDNVLTDTELTIKHGESIGIIGSSGAGKSTVVDIMLGLLVPQTGKITVDGSDINVDLNGWLNQVGYIPQMIFLLDDTIRANVAFGIKEEEISEERIWKALRDASLEGFVKGLPEGLDTEIGERGVRLSGGQRQRIGIARALYRDPSVLIFDEATSALDNETESDIMASIHSFYGKKTLIIIAHRLSTIQTCDHIYKVENKKIIKER